MDHLKRASKANKERNRMPEEVEKEREEGEGIEMESCSCVYPDACNLCYDPEKDYSTPQWGVEVTGTPTVPMGVVTSTPSPTAATEPDAHVDGMEHKMPEERTGPSTAPKPVPEANWVPPPPMAKTMVIFLQPEDWEWLVHRLRTQNKRISMLETVIVRLIGDSLDAKEEERSAGEVVEEQG